MRIKQLRLDQINSDEAFNRHQRIAEREKIRRELLIENMRDLLQQFGTQGYKVILGDEDSEWTAYLSEVEVFYPRTRIDRWRKILSVLVNSYHIEPLSFIDIPEIRLEAVSKLSKNKDEALEWLSRARTAVPLDWRNHIAEHYGKPTSEECQHDFQRFEICRICGKKHVLGDNCSDVEE
ncbi:MAG TPA: hypothetical protein PLH82_02125 [Candidatus Paceibacterota bacterium]|nr:hypothetical protein [Candidatus Paceibacterota bacterium]